MKIVIAGNLGYIGPSVTNQLRSTFPDAELIGFDIGYFAHSLVNADNLPEVKLDAQIFGDIRKFPVEILKDVDVLLSSRVLHSQRAPTDSTLSPPQAGSCVVTATMSCS